MSGRKPRKGPDLPDDTPDRIPGRKPKGPLGRKETEEEAAGGEGTDEGSGDGGTPEDTPDSESGDEPTPETPEASEEEPPRTRPYPNVRFILEIDGFPEAGFSECRIGAGATEVLRYREGNQPLTYRKIPGTTDYAPLRLERGVGDATALADWRRLVEQGEMVEARRDVAVNLLDEAGEPGPRWTLRAAWPASYEGPTLDARDGDVAIEALELVHEGLERVEMEE